VPEKIAPLFDKFGVRPRVMLWLKTHVPEFLYLQAPVFPEHRVAGQQTFNAGKERFVMRRSVIGQLIGQRAKIYLGFDRARFQQGFYFRGKVQVSLLVMHIIERFYTQPVARDKQFFFALVPNGKGEHSAQILHTVRAVLGVKMQDRFRVAVSLVIVAFGDQFVAMVGVVIDLAIVGNDQLARSVFHRLVPVRDIDDAQAAVAQANVSVCKRTGIVRPAMSDHIAHPAQNIFVYLSA
jgi:hypothetical protein